MKMIRGIQKAQEEELFKDWKDKLKTFDSRDPAK
jgi:hypothetical protein